MSRTLSRLFHRRSLARWQKAVAEAEHAGLSDLRSRRAQARELRSRLDQFLHVAEGRLALPHIGTSSFHRPHGTDWSWRPALWRGPLPAPGIAGAPTKSRLGEEATLFHDCDLSELTLRQLRNLRQEDLAPYGLRIDVFGFDGSFLSLVVDLPPEATTNMMQTHLLRVDLIIETEKPLEVFARLNIKHGPNTAQLVRELPMTGKTSRVEFDLAYTQMNEKRIEKAWLDLIFEAPEMNQIILRDLTFARHPRAAI